MIRGQQIDRRCQLQRGAEHLSDIGLWQRG